MKKLLAFLILSSVLLLAGCGTFSQKEAELGFFDEGLLAEVKLTDMPVPDDDDIRHDEDTVYCNMTEEKRIEFANKLASYLIAKDDIYYKGYHYETGCVGGIFFLPEYRFAPLTADADYGGWFAFSLTESLNNGDEYNYTYWNGVTVRVSMKEGKIGSYSYNTVIKINKDPNGIAFYPTEHEHTITYVSAGESGHFENYTCGCPHDHGAVPHYDENGDYICDACGREEEYVFVLNYDKTGYKLSDIGPAYKGGDVVIPSTYRGLPVVELEMYAFAGCKNNLTSVTIPASVKEIGLKAFAKQQNLETVIINGSTIIDVQAFYLCPNLKTVVINEGTEQIYAGAFSMCFSLESVTIADTVTKILGEAFANCTKLKTITIPASVEIIGDGCFVGSGFTDIYFEMSAPGEAWDENWDEGLYADEEIGRDEDVNLHWAEAEE